MFSWMLSVVCVKKFFLDKLNGLSASFIFGLEMPKFQWHEGESKIFGCFWYIFLFVSERRQRCVAGWSESRQRCGAGLGQGGGSGLAFALAMGAGGALPPFLSLGWLFVGKAGVWRLALPVVWLPHHFWAAVLQFQRWEVVVYCHGKK